MAVITSDEPYFSSWSAPGPPQNANEQAAQSMMQAGIGSLSGNIYDGLASQMTTSPSGNKFYRPNFNVVDQNTTHGMRYKGGTNQEDILKSGYFSNSYFTDPITGQKFGNSISNFQGPNREWGEARHIYPDASGYGQRWDSEGNESYYPIQLKGPQTWNYDPGKYDNMGITNPNLGEISGMNENDLYHLMRNGYTLEEAQEILNEQIGDGSFEVTELTQDQMNMMGHPLNTPDFGVSKEDLWNKTKDMEDQGFWGWGAQEPTTQEEFEDYYRRLQEGSVGNWVT